MFCGVGFRFLFLFVVLGFVCGFVVGVGFGGVGFWGLCLVYCFVVANFRDVSLSVDDCLEMRDLWVYFDCLGDEFRFTLGGLADMFNVGVNVCQRVLAGSHVLLDGLGLGSVLLYGVEADVRRAEFWALRGGFPVDEDAKYVDAQCLVVKDNAPKGNAAKQADVHWSMWFLERERGSRALPVDVVRRKRGRPRKVVPLDPQESALQEEDPQAPQESESDF